MNLVERNNELAIISRYRPNFKVGKFLCSIDGKLYYYIAVKLDESISDKPSWSLLSETTMHWTFGSSSEQYVEKNVFRLKFKTLHISVSDGKAFCFNEEYKAKNAMFNFILWGHKKFGQREFKRLLSNTLPF